MTTTIFVSGSRGIGRLNGMIRKRIERMMDQGFHIVVGDAKGADKAFQGYLAEAQYDNVEVFCSGRACRNNIGKWTAKNIDVDPKLKGRDFYTVKDRAMALEADYGFVLWDGKSTGSINNIVELLKGRRPVVVYFAPNRDFYDLNRMNDVRALLERCGQSDYRNIMKRTRLDPQFADIAESSQESFGL